MSESVNNDTATASPCISICVLDNNDICQGCYRTAEEITAWLDASEAKKRVILRRCQERFQAQQPVFLK